MLQDGLLLVDGSSAVNFQIDYSTILPVSGANIGELFYLTSGATPGLYIYSGSSWNSTGGSTGLANTLIGTTLAPNVVTSSLTSVGTLSSLTVSGNASAADPTTSTHLTTKLYVDNMVQGLTWKTATVVATTVNITLSGAQTLDGVAVVAGNRVLVKNQTTATQNGIYLVAAGVWVRTSDMDGNPSAGEVNGAAVYVTDGTINGDTTWTQTVTIVTVGTQAMSFAQLSGGGTSNAGALTGTTLAANVVSSSLTSVGTITTGTWSGLFDAVSGANLTSLNATNLTTGIVAVARLAATGTPSATTFLRGDSNWVSIAAGAAVAGSDTHIQYNAAGAQAGSSSFAWDNTNNSLIFGANNTSAIIRTPDFSAAAQNVSGITIRTGNSTNGSLSGVNPINIVAGNVAAGTSSAPGGSINLTAGNTAASTGIGGSISLFAGTGTNGGGSVSFRTGTSNNMVLAASGALGFGSTVSYGTIGQVLTSNGVGTPPTWGGGAGGAAGALTGSTLASNVTASSLTSVGVLPSLTVTNLIAGTPGNTTANLIIRGANNTSGGNSGFNGHLFLQGGFGSAGSGGGGYVHLQTSSGAALPSSRLTVTNNGNVLIGTGVALATTATAGFFSITGSAGIPTGVPTSEGTTTAGITNVPLHADTTNNLLYFYSGNAWRSTNAVPAGEVTFTGGVSTAPAAVTFSATAMAVNCALSNVFTTTFTANVTTVPTFTNLKNGQTITWIITQDATGSRTIVWPISFKWPLGLAGALSTSAGSVDLLTATYMSGTGFWYVSLLKAFA